MTDNDFPQRPKPWTWEFAPEEDAYHMRDANGNVLFAIRDEHLDREQDLEHIATCVNAYERLTSRVQELEEQQQQRPAQGTEGSALERDTQTHELEQKIVRLELYRFEFQHLTEEISELKRYAAYLKKSGKALPRADVLRRKQLGGAWLKRAEELTAEFPHIIAPLFLEDEIQEAARELFERTRRPEHPSSSDSGGDRSGGGGSQVLERKPEPSGESYEEHYQRAVTRNREHEHKR